MPITNVAQYVAMVAGQVTVNMRFGYWRIYENLLAYADADDPESFDRFGRPASDPEHGDLGFYPVLGLGGSLEPYYLPNWARLQLIAGGEVDPEPPAPPSVKVRGQPMISTVPGWDGHSYCALVIPVMHLGSAGLFSFQQTAVAAIPYAGDELPQIDAVRRPDGLEIIISWDEP